MPNYYGGGETWTRLQGHVMATIAPHTYLRLVKFGDVLRKIQAGQIQRTIPAGIDFIGVRTV